MERLIMFLVVLKLVVALVWHVVHTDEISFFAQVDPKWVLESIIERT